MRLAAKASCLYGRLSSNVRRRKQPMRESVAQLSALGRLPTDSQASVDQVRIYEGALGQVSAPLSNQEALALLGLLPHEEGSCFGLAWTLVHLIETAPGWPLPALSDAPETPWTSALRERAGWQARRTDV